MPGGVDLPSGGTAAGRGFASLRRSLGESAVPAVLDEPAAGDRGQRCRRDAERAEAVGAVCDDRVGLEHPPLVARARYARQPAQPAGERDRKSTRLNSSPYCEYRMLSSASIKHNTT